MVAFYFLSFEVNYYYYFVAKPKLVKAINQVYYWVTINPKHLPYVGVHKYKILECSNIIVIIKYIYIYIIEGPSYNL